MGGGSDLTVFLVMGFVTLVASHMFAASAGCAKARRRGVRAFFYRATSLVTMLVAAASIFILGYEMSVYKGDRAPQIATASSAGAK